MIRNYNWISTIDTWVIFFIPSTVLWTLVFKSLDVAILDQRIHNLLIFRCLKSVDVVDVFWILNISTVTFKFNRLKFIIAFKLLLLLLSMLSKFAVVTSGRAHKLASLRVICLWNILSSLQLTPHDLGLHITIKDLHLTCLSSYTSITLISLTVTHLSQILTNISIVIFQCLSWSSMRYLLTVLIRWCIATLLNSWSGCIRMRLLW